MLTGLEALEDTVWSRLHHAYGRAIDTPGHLLALLQDDAELRKRATAHLWSAIIHQGTPWTATKPTALVVAGFLTDDRIDRDGSLRANLLSFLVAVAQAPEQAGLSVEELRQMARFDIDPYLDSDDDDAIYETEDAANSFYAQSILGCIEVAPELLKVMLQGLDNPTPRIRACAAMGAVMLAKVDSLRNHADDIESRLITLARTAKNTDERSAHVLALGDLGYLPREFLNDPSPAVRMCAALAPSLSDDSAAIRELLIALEDHAANIDDWFVEKPPQFPMRPRFRVVSRLVEEVPDFERLVSAAIAVLSVTSKHCVDFDWGPMLAAAFSDGSGTITSDSQRRFLAALVERRDLWDPANGNALKWFKDAGLPYDRLACEKKVKEAKLQDGN